MSAIRVAITALGVAATVARHPVVRAGLRAAPLLITPRMRQAAGEVALTAAYTAGAVARRVIRGK